MEEPERLRKNVSALQIKLNNMKKKVGFLQDKLTYKKFKISCYEDFIDKLKKEERVTIKELKKEPLSDRQIRMLFEFKKKHMGLKCSTTKKQ